MYSHSPVVRRHDVKHEPPIGMTREEFIAKQTAAEHQIRRQVIPLGIIYSIYMAMTFATLLFFFPFYPFFFLFFSSFFSGFFRFGSSFFFVFFFLLLAVLKFLGGVEGGVSNGCGSISRVLMFDKVEVKNLA